MTIKLGSLRSNRFSAAQTSVKDNPITSFYAWKKIVDLSHFFDQTVAQLVCLKEWGYGIHQVSDTMKSKSAGGYRFSCH